MISNHLKGCFILITFCLISCESADIIDNEPEDLGTMIALTNWTGHWRNCDKGETLIFLLKVNNKTAEEFTITQDSGAAFWSDIEEGDLLQIQIMQENRNVILRGSKTFMPSDPERVDLANRSRTPNIRVCKLNQLDLFDF